MQKLIRIYKKLNLVGRLIYDIAWTIYFWRPFKNFCPKITKNNKACVLLLNADSIYVLKISALLLIPFRLKGMPTEIIQIHDGSLYQSLFRIFALALGFKNIQFIKIDDKKLRQYNKILLENIIDESSALAYEYKGIPVGLYATSKVCRRRKSTKFDNTNEFKADIIYEINTCIQLINILHEQKNFSKGDIILTGEALYSPYAAIIDLALSFECDVLQWIQPWRDDGISLRRISEKNRLYHPTTVDICEYEKFVLSGWSVANEARLQKILSDRYKGIWALQSRNTIGGRRFSKPALLNELQLDPNKKTVALFSHVLWDANFFYGKDLFPNMSDWLVESIAAMMKNDRVNWIVKEHPGNVWKHKLEGTICHSSEEAFIRSRLGREIENVRFLPGDSEISSESLYSAVDGLITIRGTSGLEAPCFGKPVFLAGSGRYSGLGFTHDFDTVKDYLKAIGNMHQLCEPLNENVTEMAKKHALLSFDAGVWKVESFHLLHSDLTNPTDVLRQNVIPRQRINGSIMEKSDMVNLARWLDSNESSYIDKNSLK